MRAQGSRPQGRSRAAARGRIAVAAAAMAASAALALALGSTSGADAAKPRKPTKPARPNIVVIMSDDQTVQSTQYQKHVMNEIAAHGATFDNSFVNYSLCCPSRSTFLTGLYAHNHHVLGNAPPRGGFVRFERVDANNDLPLWLQASGYYTGEVGKYLNGTGNTNPTEVPPGWNEWYGIAGPVNFYNYALNENGTLVNYGEQPSDYVDDVITGKAVDFIHRNADQTSPFFLYVAYKAPHGGPPHPSGQRCANGPPEPPPRHFGQFSDTPLPEPPDFNEADVSDKPRFVQESPLLTPERIAAEQTLYQCELESLQGVDDGVNSIVDALKSAGTLKNTLLIYTSDNGFFHGEHRIYTGKVKVYEPSIRVPLFMRGPGIPDGVHVRDLVINADLAPTIVEAAQARAHRIMNGLPLLSDAQHPRRELGRRLLIEGDNFHAIRTQRFIFVQYDDGEQELYDLQTDPYELQNQVTNPFYAPIRDLLAEELSHLRDCHQDGCARLPRLTVKLHYPRAPSRLGGPCTKGDITAQVIGHDRGLVTQSDFTVDGVAVPPVTTPPFQVIVPVRTLDTRHHARVHVTIEMLDGRELTLAKVLPPRCS
jgi:N-acetylglucosamine-6-sulfatase